LIGASLANTASNTASKIEDARQNAVG